MSILQDKVLLITGGTGSFGKATLHKFIKSDVKEIRIFSRDEAKQDELRHRLQRDYPEHANKVKFIIGDVRDYRTLERAVKGVDYIFHAAALKQVPSCEFFPVEAVKTNVLGTANVLDAAIEMGVKNVVCLSTDKAVYPVNAMGMTKSLMEKIAYSKSRESTGTTICCTRYGNILCSRGSVVPIWIDQIESGKPITITNPKMTRFIMSVDEALDLVMFAFLQGQKGDLFVQKVSACSLEVLAKAVISIFDNKANIKIVGSRHGEKIYETLLTADEVCRAEDLGDFYRIKLDGRSLNYNNNTADETNVITEELTSNNCRLLTVEEVKEKLLKLDYIQERLKTFKKSK